MKNHTLWTCFVGATVPALGLIGEDSGLVEFSIEDSTLADEDLSLTSDATDTLLAGTFPRLLCVLPLTDVWHQALAR